MKTENDFLFFEDELLESEQIICRILFASFFILLALERVFPGTQSLLEVGEELCSYYLCDALEFGFYLGMARCGGVEPRVKGSFIDLCSFLCIAFE